MIILFIVKVKIFFLLYNIKSCRPYPIKTTIESRIVNKLWMSRSPISFEHVFMVSVVRSNLIKYVTKL
jgi:hypothetical protein